jgi:hypothetical protein
VFAGEAIDVELRGRAWAENAAQRLCRQMRQAAARGRDGRA